MDKFGHPRLCDFGLSSITTDFNSVNASSARSGQGTVQWMSPELLNPPKSFDLKADHPTKASDMYAFAMVVIEVITHEYIFTSH
jgi:serine/threonine protein kinase